jgi:hypothetical protein
MNGKGYRELQLPVVGTIFRRLDGKKKPHMVQLKAHIIQIVNGKCRKEDTRSTSAAAYFHGGVIRTRLSV